MTVPVIGFNPTGRRQGNRPRGAIGGGFGGGSIPSTKSSNVQVSGLLLNLLDRYTGAQEAVVTDQEDRERRLKLKLSLEDQGYQNVDSIVDNMKAEDVVKQLLLPEQVQQAKGKMNASALLPLLEQNQDSGLPDFEDRSTDLGTTFVDDGTGQQRGIRGLELGPMNVEGQNKSFLQNLVEQATSQTQIGNALTSQQLLKMSPEEREEALALQAENLTSIAEQNKAIQNARTMFGQLGVNESNNALVNFIRGETGLLGEDSSVAEAIDNMMDHFPKEANLEVINAATRLNIDYRDMSIPQFQQFAQTASSKVQEKKLALEAAEFHAKQEIKKDLPLGEKAALFVDEDGNSPSPNMTHKEFELAARRLGTNYIVLTPQMRKDMNSAVITSADIERMIELAPYVFSNIPAERRNIFKGSFNSIRRLLGTAGREVRQFITKDNPKLAEYKRLYAGLLGNFARGTGQVGNLNEGEQARARQLMFNPLNPVPLPQVINGLRELAQLMSEGKIPKGVTGVTQTQKKVKQEKKLVDKYKEGMP